MRNWSVFVVICMGLLAGCTNVPNGVTPVADFELAKYLGKWYEIARLDHSFERGLSNVTAQYTMRSDGGVSVLNRGYHQNNGQWDEALGKAYFVSEDSVGHLKVSFFGPFYASYVIAELDKPNYQYALITGPDTDYLWILARQPTLSKAIVDELTAKARALGFDTQKLIFVQHDQA